MGYRHYFYCVPKTQIEEIKNCKTNDEFCDWAESKGYEVDRYDDENPYCSISNIGKEIYEFGKYVDWAFKMQEKNERLFASEELIKQYEDEMPVICTQEDFLSVIHIYKQKIVDYYKGLLEKDDETKARHIKGQLYEWVSGYCPINTDLTKECITHSWLYEYSIFELVRLYKTFDFENIALVLLGW